eukprot:1931509-Pyramimonas_sp.AAC.1
MHVQFRPVTMKGYVDDLTQSKLGAPEDILNHLAPAAMYITHELQQLNCSIPDKSTLVCSHLEHGKELQLRFQLTGLPIKLAGAARDLG